MILESAQMLSTAHRELDGNVPAILYKSTHKTWDKLGKLLETAPKNIEDNGWVDPPQCMPDHCKKPDTVTAYRNYYMQEKASISTWKYSNQPQWWTV